MPFWKRIFTKRSSFEIFEEYFLDFEMEYQLPSWDSLQIRLSLLKNNSTFSDLAIEEDFIVEYLEEGKSDHHLIGCYVGLQESVYEILYSTTIGFVQKDFRNLSN